MKIDQTGLQFSQETQSKSDQILFKVIEEMLEGVQIFDDNLNYLYINKTAEKQNQRPKEELLGKSYEESWPGIEKTEVYKKIKQSQNEHINIQFENEFNFPDGSKGWFYLSLQPIDDGILILSLDITSRIILGQEISNRERLYHSLFENLINGFAYCKMEFIDGKQDDFVYLSVNKAFESLTGLSNVVGKKVSEVIPGIQESDAQLLATYGRVAETGIPETFEVFLEALQMWFLVSVYSPEKGYFVAIFDVITERKNAEHKLHEQLDELQRWYSATIDRELRTIELKKEINQLLIDMGKNPKYSIEGESKDKLFGGP
jgi:PAS domain S-box-containing protein